MAWDEKAFATRVKWNFGPEQGELNPVAALQNMKCSSRFQKETHLHGCHLSTETGGQGRPGLAASWSSPNQ